MLDASQYQQLSQFKDVAKHLVETGIYVGMDQWKFKRVYEPIANETVDLSCGGCQDVCLRRTYDLLKEYENKK